MLVDLPGSLEDQQDPVHLCHLGHPESNRGDSTDVNAHPTGVIKTCAGVESLTLNSFVKLNDGKTTYLSMHVGIAKMIMVFYFQSKYPITLLVATYVGG